RLNWGWCRRSTSWTRWCSGAGLDAVLRLVGAGGVAGALGAAEEPAVDLGAVADDLAPAVLADRRHEVDGALEAVEGVALARRHHLERLVVVVAADLTLRHIGPPRSVRRSVAAPRPASALMRLKGAPG